jgi:hypothetical protein
VAHTEQQKDRWVGAAGPLVGVVVGAFVSLIPSCYQLDRAEIAAQRELRQESFVAFVSSARSFQSGWKDGLSCSAGESTSDSIISITNEIQSHRVHLEILFETEEMSEFTTSVVREVNSMRAIVVRYRDSITSGTCEESNFPNGDDLVDLDSDLIDLLDDLPEFDETQGR